MNILLENSDEVATELEKKNDEYLEYLDKHINGVITAFKNFFVPLAINSDESITVGKYSNAEFVRAIKVKALSIDKHDLSKYNDLEFEPYRRHFYPTLEEQNADEDQKRAWEEGYDKAWEHHYEHNSHHIEYWYDHKNSIPHDMDLESIIEMICDWISMAYYFDNGIDEWWNNQEECKKERSMMTPETINIVNDIYKIIKK